MNCLICCHGSSTGKLFCSALNNLLGFKIIQMKKTRQMLKQSLIMDMIFLPPSNLKRKRIYGKLHLEKQSN